MPRYLDTRGETKLAIGICARCSLKFPYSQLHPDPNYPGLYVCDDDVDQLDPYRLPARATEDITLDHPRPDVAIDSPGPSPIFIPPVDGINQAGFLGTWAAETPYLEGNTVSPQNINDPAINLPQPWLMCITPGISGTVQPSVNIAAGVRFQDGTVTWLCLGLYPN